MHTQAMLAAHPQPTTPLSPALQACIDACFDCAQACTSCADACLAEAQPQQLTRCIRLDQDCADICATTGRLLSRQTATEPSVITALVQTCATACKACGDECAIHAQHGMQQCAVCAEACRQCEAACQRLLAA